MQDYYYQNISGRVSEFEDWIKAVVQNNKSLQDFTLDAVKEPLVRILRLIKVQKIVSSDLDLKLEEYPNIVPRFFEVKTVVQADEVRKLDKRLDQIDAKISNLSDSLEISPYFVESSLNVPHVLPDSLSPSFSTEHFVGRVEILEEIMATTKVSRILMILSTR